MIRICVPNKLFMIGNVVCMQHTHNNVIISYCMYVTLSFRLLFKITVNVFHLCKLFDHKIIKLLETTCYLCDIISIVVLLQGNVFVM